ncbi:MAG: pyruvate dehydrogenase (acetyl-transferring), homodimeric type, partial [Proteobacteria bacterium]|nr:pyruvate dehydrogenase (acetyl-transferring), homodimeric type [Pseudomonadota bacterium]
PHKMYAAYAAAVEYTGQPTVILAKTVKGYGMGEAGEGQNITHQQKKMGLDALKAFRDRFHIPISDDEIAEAPFFKPPEDSAEMQYFRERRRALGGYLPYRRTDAPPLATPDLDAFQGLLESTGEREVATTMAAVRLLQLLVRDKNVGRFVVPIVPDESRTFGMEAMFRRLGIYSSVGQLYEPVDSDQLAFYREDKQGQILQEGINEAGAMCSWIAAGTAYSNHGINMIPVYIFYSMFGFQRVGDLAWAAGDAQVRGFLLGGTAGGTTLAGDGLHHQDGHSHLLAATIPNCKSYDPAFAYELAVIFQDGLRRMFREQENVFYYITVMNEKYVHPALPKGAEEGIIRGMYLFREAEGDPRVQLLGSGTILREVLAAADLLLEDFGVAADIWSVTSWSELARDGHDADRWNRLHPESEPRLAYVSRCLAKRTGPVVAASDYMRAVADQIRANVPARYHVLGTDGYGRSDTRRKLRQFFEVDRFHVAVAALRALAEEGGLERARVSEAIHKYGIDPDKPNPMAV